jgi:hypothetical protein
MDGREVTEKDRDGIYSDSCELESLNCALVVVGDSGEGGQRSH